MHKASVNVLNLTGCAVYVNATAKFITCTLPEVFPASQGPITFLRDFFYKLSVRTLNPKRTKRDLLFKKANHYRRTCMHTVLKFSCFSSNCLIIFLKPPVLYKEKKRNFKKSQDKCWNLPVTKKMHGWIYCLPTFICGQTVNSALKAV